MSGHKNQVEVGFERLLFASRWLMAPMYLGLVFALLGMLAVFLRETIYYVPQMFSFQAGAMSGDSAILAVLTLIDLTLAANLLCIVIYTGYENFVSKMDLPADAERPSWMGTVDFSGLKMKLIASMVAISGIHLLKKFMEFGKTGTVDTEAVYWMVVLHMVFVISGLAMAAMDWIVGKTAKKSY